MIRRECQIDGKFNIYMKPAQKVLRLFCVLFSVSFAMIISFTPSYLFAATLYLSPNSGSYHEKDTFLIDIRLDTEGEYINAVEVGLDFPNDILEFVDFSKGNSVLSLWLKEPELSNENGVVSFIGGTPAGYQGPDGTLGRVVFRARENNPSTSLGASAKLVFLDNSQVLLNDGLGTEANLKTKGASFNILAGGQGNAVKDEWGEKLKKDTVPPEPFDVGVNQDKDLFDGKYFLTFSTVDKQTGVERYELAKTKGNLSGLLLRLLKIKKRWETVKSPYVLKDKDAKKEIEVKAVDKAGNYRTVALMPVPSNWYEDYLIWVIIGMVGILIWRIIRSRNRREKILRY